MEVLEDRLALSAGPLAVPDSYAVRAGVPLTVEASAGVLANDTGAGLQARLFAGPSHGTLALDDNAGDAGGGGSTLYTIDAQADELVRLDRLTGTTTVVGPIGHPVYNVDMAYQDGVLYALTSDGPNLFGTPGWTLLGLDVRTGAAVSAVTVHTAAGQPPLTIVDGIAASGGKLIVLYDTADLTPMSLGQLDPPPGASPPWSISGRSWASRSTSTGWAPPRTASSTR